MSEQPTIRKYGRNSGPDGGRAIGRLIIRLRRLITENMKACKVLVIKGRVKLGIDETNRIENALRYEAMILANAATPHERWLCEAAANTPFRSVESILMPAEQAQLNDGFSDENKDDIYQEAPARTKSQHIWELRTIENQRELSGTTTYERARLAFARSGVQMFCDTAKDGLFGRDWLFHQKAREHRGGCFVEPLFEQSINFLF